MAAIRVTTTTEHFRRASRWCVVLRPDLSELIYANLSTSLLKLSSECVENWPRRRRTSDDEVADRRGRRRVAKALRKRHERRTAARVLQALISAAPRPMVP